MKDKLKSINHVILIAKMCISGLKKKTKKKAWVFTLQFFFFFFFLDLKTKKKKKKERKMLKSWKANRLLDYPFD